MNDQNLSKGLKIKSTKGDSVTSELVSTGEWSCQWRAHSWPLMPSLFVTSRWVVSWKYPLYPAVSQELEHFKMSDAAPFDNLRAFFWTCPLLIFHTYLSFLFRKISPRSSTLFLLMKWKLLCHLPGCVFIMLIFAISLRHWLYNSCGCFHLIGLVSIFSGTPCFIKILKFLREEM
jgi:hypothetical protein